MFTTQLSLSACKSITLDFVRIQSKGICMQVTFLWSTSSCLPFRPVFVPEIWPTMTTTVVLLTPHALLHQCTFKDIYALFKHTVMISLISRNGTPGCSSADAGRQRMLKHTPRNNKNVRLFGVRAPIFILILMGVRSVMGSGKYFTDIRSKLWNPYLGIFWKPWTAPYVAAGAFFFQKNYPHIFGSLERPPMLPQALFFSRKMAPGFLEALHVQLRCRRRFFFPEKWPLDFWRPHHN